MESATPKAIVPPPAAQPAATIGVAAPFFNARSSVQISSYISFQVTFPYFTYQAK